MQDVERWAAEEFGDAELGDLRRTQRLVKLAAEVALAPAGTVTRACRSSAAQEGAFRWLENAAVRHKEVVSATTRATLRRCVNADRVHVPIDGTALTLTDRNRSKDLGPISDKNGPRGVHVMTAFAVGSDGVPKGIVGQRMWVREPPTRRAPSKANKDKETQYWLELIRSTHEAFEEQAPGCEPFFQLDRGADCWPVLSLAKELKLLLTVRAAHDRRVDTDAGRLWKEVRRAKVRAVFRLNVAARQGLRRRRRIDGQRKYWRVNRSARVAEMEVRAISVPLILNKEHRVVFQVVLVRERHPRNGDRIEWMLLSTHSIRTKADLRAIIEGYTRRWRIEELHRNWKSGLCCIEDTQLRSRQAIFKWATILASVASRAMHLTYLARQEPERPALSELSRYELEAVIALRQPKNVRIGDAVTLGQAVRWIADLGGYANPHQGPPGPTVIGRGLDDVIAAARAFENRDKM